MKKIAFRFDVDTERCLREGVPNILHLGNKYHCQFTFYVNMGKAVNQFWTIKNIARRGNKTNYTKLSSLKKLGFLDYLKTATLNPYVGKSNLGVIKNIMKSNHEIGLHGGLNHDNWAYDSENWSDARLSKEVRWGSELLRNIGVNYRLGFSSPMWVHPAKLSKILREQGFLYTANSHGLKKYTRSKRDGLFDFPTNILGEPGGIGFIEYCRAKNMRDSQLVNAFFARAESLANPIVYDHPYYAGVKEVAILETIIKLAIKRKFRFVKVRKLYD